MRRAKSARAVIQAAETHGMEIGKGATALLAPHAGKGGLPDLAGFTKACAAALLHTTERMEAADTAHEKELADDIEPRETRDVQAEALRVALVRYRGMVEGVYGRRGLRALGFAGKVPQEVKALVAYAEAVRAGLRDKTAKLPAPLEASLTFDRAKLATSLERLCDKLEAAMADVAREGREAESTLKTKHRAITAHDEMFRRVAAFITAAFELAGEPELAERVRPSDGRSGVLEADADEPDAEDEAGPGGGVSEAPA